MFNVVKIGAEDVPMLAMASVDIFYRNIFHEDAYKVQTNLDDPGDAITFYSQMGFIMAKFAECRSREGMKELREDDYIDWLSQFDREALFDALADVQKTYNGQSVTNADAKKNSDQPSET